MSHIVSYAKNFAARASKAHTIQLVYLLATRLQLLKTTRTTENKAKMSNALRVLIANERHFRGSSTTTTPAQQTPAEATRIARRRRQRHRAESEEVIEAIGNRFHAVFPRGLPIVKDGVLRWLLRKTATNHGNARTAQLLRAIVDEFGAMPNYWLLSALRDWLTSGCVDIGSRRMLEVTMESFCAQHPKTVTFLPVTDDD